MIMISFLINGKTPLECSEKDLRLIIDNPDYRESGFVDYKTAFSFLNDKADNKTKEKHIDDFRKDVCSFANAKGGYLIYGIAEEGGIPVAIEGIAIDNTDQFERYLKDLLSKIIPRIPSYSIGFIQLQNGKNVVVLSIKHDNFYPYMQLIDQNYQVFRRVGNSNTLVRYNELKEMFTQPPSLKKEIERFRHERIESYNAQADDGDSIYSKYVILHVFPETFLEGNYNQPLFALVRRGQRFGSIFESFQCNHEAFPTVEGLKYPDLYNGESECRLNNNGIAELFYSASALTKYRLERFPNGFFEYDWVWEAVKKSLLEYFKRIHSLFPCDRFFVCFSVVGCKGVSTELYGGGIIDRNLLLMEPAVFEDVDNPDKVNNSLDCMKLNYLLSLGIRDSNEIQYLIEKVHPTFAMEDGDNN